MTTNQKPELIAMFYTVEGMDFSFFDYDTASAAAYRHRIRNKLPLEKEPKVQRFYHFKGHTIPHANDNLGRSLLPKALTDLMDGTLQAAHYHEGETFELLDYPRPRLGLNTLLLPIR